MKIALLCLMVVFETLRLTKTQDYPQDVTSNEDDPTDTQGLPRSIGFKKPAGQPGKPVESKRNFPFDATPDPNYHVAPGQTMLQILTKYNESTDPFDEDYYAQYEFEFSKGAKRYPNFHQKEIKYQQEVLQTMNGTQLVNHTNYKF